MLGNKKNKHIYLYAQSTNFHFGLNRVICNRKKFSFSTGFKPKVGNNKPSKKNTWLQIANSNFLIFSLKKREERAQFRMLPIQQNKAI